MHKEKNQENQDKILRKIKLKKILKKIQNTAAEEDAAGREMHEVETRQNWKKIQLCFN